MTRHEAIETLLDSKFEAWRMISVMTRTLFEHRYPDERLKADRNAIVKTIANFLNDDQLCTLAETFGGDPFPPLILRGRAS